MTQEPGSIKVVELSDGSKAYILDSEQLAALAVMLDNAIWWDGAWKRSKRVGAWATAAIATLALLASWWPWIITGLRFLIPKE